MENRAKKIVKYQDLSTAQSQWQKQATVLVGGCFDILHFGHLAFLDHAKKEGDILIVALESDEFISKKKKRNSVHTQEQRATILAALDVVDYVILLPYFSSDAEYSELVQKTKPNIIAVTEGDPFIEKKKEQAKKNNAEVKTVTPLISNLSSKQIINYATIFSD